MATIKKSKQIVCDTNVFINLLRNDKKTIETVNQIGENNIVMPVISALELIKGTQNKNELAKVNEFILSFHSLQINRKGINLSLELLTKYHLSHNSGLADAMIAASVIIAKMKLFTFNIKDFDYIKSLDLYFPSNFSYIKRR